jgi:hypothetical protein
MITSDFNVKRYSRRSENSEMKSGLERAGGRYIVTRINEKVEFAVKESLAQLDSKDEKEGKAILVKLMEER